MSKAITCFKAYDARGKVPDDLNEEIAYRIGRAYAEFIQPDQVAVGRDVRLSSESLFAALCAGLTDSGVDVLDLGLCGTEHVYFAAFHLQLGGGIMITASHNPIDYNGLKFVRECAKPLSADSGLVDIQRIAEDESFSPATRKGSITPTDLSAAYIDHLLGYIGNRDALKPLKIVVNAGNGMAGPVIDLLEAHTCRLNSSRFITSPMATFPTAFRIPCSPRDAARPSMRSSSMALISASPGMGISIAAFCSITTVALSRVTTWSACSACNCWSRIPASASCTTRA